MTMAKMRYQDTKSNCYIDASNDQRETEHK